MWESLARVNAVVGGVVWGPVGLALLFGTGCLLTVRTGFFQLRYFGYWMRHTIGAIFLDRNVTAHTDDEAISQFQSLCTALAATIGTGNIVGVAAAILAGGPGAVFWMWVMALLGMMTSYAENVLGICYRRRDAAGRWCGGPMYYLAEGLGGGFGRALAVLFACFCVLASFGMGNMSQINSIAGNLQAVFRVPAGGNGHRTGPAHRAGHTGRAEAGGRSHGGHRPAHGPVLPVRGTDRGLCPLGGCPGGIRGHLPGGVWLAGRRGRGAGLRHGPGHQLGIQAGSLFQRSRTGRVGAGALRDQCGGACPAGNVGHVRGVRRYHGGLHPHGSCGTHQRPCGFGHRCGPDRCGGLRTGGAGLSTAFGAFGPQFIAVSVLLFAYSTTLGWSHYGTRAVVYLLGERAAAGYKLVFAAMVLVGAVMKLDLAWALSDTFNGLMMLPNLVGVVGLSGVVVRETQAYLKRK